tara:strand:+ start:533 stop:2221 length:1689 start_codon:yes stop_codon:yes gene_type:complete
VNKKVIYTSVFGKTEENNYHLHKPDVVLDGYDFVCFTDDETFKSDFWQVKLVKPLYDDGARNAKRYKLKPHIYLSEYEISVWVDIEVKITKDIDHLVESSLKDSNLAILNHELCGRTVSGDLNVRKCVYEEAKFIQWLGDNSPKKQYKDNMDIIHAQVDRYRKDGYPENNGLARTTVVFRRHNESDVIKNSDAWWEEMKYGSRRDQISFNYVSWKHNLKFNYIQEDIDDNPYFLYMKKWRQIKRKEKRNSYIEYQPISLEYFLNMKFAGGGGGKEIITQNETLRSVEDVYTFFSTGDNLQSIRNTLNPKNWQYFNSMTAEFRKNVASHHELGWDKMTEEYYSSLELMSDEELEIFLKNNPVEFDNGFIKHSYHRACAMIGRLISGKEYLPFYMKKDDIYNNPRKHDGRHRVKPLIENVKCISDIQIPAGEFTICQSGILALMDIRQNDDIDIIISSEARKQLFNETKDMITLNNVEIFAENRGKFRIFDAQGDDDLIKNYSFTVNGYNFLEPRFYFSRKNKHTDRDKSDWNGIRTFFQMRNYMGYPFNKLSLEQWGIEYINE